MAPPAAPPLPRPPAVAALPRTSPAAGALLRQALEATPNGVTVVDLRLPDQPLVYANAAFAELAGLPLQDVLGRNCRFLQTPDTDPAAVARIRAAVDQGTECRLTLLNHRG